MDEWADDRQQSANLLGARMEVNAPPFPQDVQDNQTIDRYHQVNLVTILHHSAGARPGEAGADQRLLHDLKQVGLLLWQRRPWWAQDLQCLIHIYRSHLLRTFIHTTVSACYQPIPAIPQSALLVLMVEKESGGDRHSSARHCRYPPRSRYSSPSHGTVLGPSAGWVSRRQSCVKV